MVGAMILRALCRYFTSLFPAPLHGQPHCCCFSTLLFVAFALSLPLSAKRFSAAHYAAISYAKMPCRAISPCAAPRAFIFIAIDARPMRVFEASREPASLALSRVSRSRRASHIYRARHFIYRAVCAHHRMAIGRRALLHEIPRSPLLILKSCFHIAKMPRENNSLANIHSGREHIEHSLRYAFWPISAIVAGVSQASSKMPSAKDRPRARRVRHYFAPERKARKDAHFERVILVSARRISFHTSSRNLASQ